MAPLVTTARLAVGPLPRALLRVRSSAAAASAPRQPFERPLIPVKKAGESFPETTRRMSR